MTNSRTFPIFQTHLTYICKMNYDSCEHEYMELKSQFHQERMLEPTEPYDGGYVFVDDDQEAEVVGFRSIEGAVEYAHILSKENYAIYQLKKVL